MFFSNSDIMFTLIFCVKLEAYRGHMFGSNPVLQLWFKTVSTNQITKFFKLQYLNNGLAV